MSDQAGLDEEPDILLYRLHGCPYCERVVRHLQALDIPFRSRFVAGEHSRRDAVARESGLRSVPLLVDRERGVTLAESDNIVTYLESTYRTDPQSIEEFA